MHSLVSEILTEQQLDRYSAFRRSSLRKGMQASKRPAHPCCSATLAPPPCQTHVVPLGLPCPCLRVLPVRCRRRRQPHTCIRPCAAATPPACSSS